MADNLQYGKPSGRTVEYLDKYFLSPFRTGYVTCEGTVLPEYFTHFGDRIQEMNVRSDDIWLCSFPKTGTTLTQEMVWCIANNMDLKAAEKPLEKRFQFLERSIVFDFQQVMPKVGDTSYLDFTQNSIGLAVDMESPRFIKSHLPFNLLPAQLQHNEAKIKIIYVTRNPRDTCISYFHHSRNLEGYTGDFEQFCELFLEGNVPFGPFWNHIQSFWEIRDKLNVLILKYEDMMKDLKSVVYKIANFLEKSPSDDQVTKLLDHLSFEKMKANAAVNRQSIYDFLKRYRLQRVTNEFNFLRSGKVGEWKEVMDAKLEQRFEKWQQENLKNADESLIRFFNYTT